MANEFYQPIAYPTFQYAAPYDPIRGAIEAYSTGMGLRQQKQQMEMQKQQAEMQKQQMAMSQQRLDMETKREMRQARMAELDETLKKMEVEPKIELQSMFQAYQQAVTQNPDLPPEQRYKAAWQMVQQAKFPQTREAARKMIMMDMESQYPTPELQAQAETLIFGTPVTPEQVKMRDAKLVTDTGGAALYSAKGEILSESTTARQKREEEWKQKQFEATEKHRRSMEARASSGGGEGGADFRREAGAAEQAARNIWAAEQKLKRQLDMAQQLRNEGDLSAFGDMFKDDAEMRRLMDAPAEVKKMKASEIERRVAREKPIVEKQRQKYLKSFDPSVLAYVKRTAPDLDLDTWEGKPASTDSPYAKDKQNPLLPRPDEIKMPPKASVAAPAPNPVATPAPNPVTTGSTMLGYNATPEQKAARRQEIMGQQPAAPAAPIAQPAPVQRGFGKRSTWTSLQNLGGGEINDILLDVQEKRRRGTLSKQEAGAYYTQIVNNLPNLTYNAMSEDQAKAALAILTERLNQP